jgi:Fe2+ or Zn2+ uptake regulation protein
MICEVGTHLLCCKQSGATITIDAKHISIMNANAVHTKSAARSKHTVAIDTLAMYI